MSTSTAEKELRIGLVLYGGVSLCIYIYGVAYEFLRLARQEGPYKTLAEQAHVTPVIDVISGTSAGGINGLFLAKALATGADLAPLKDLWIRDGDLEQLIDTTSKSPASLLDSRHYVEQIEAALQRMSRTADPRRVTYPLLDLFITATDLDGVLTSLDDPLGTRIDTKEYGTMFHFQVRPGQYRFADTHAPSDTVRQAITAGRQGRNDFAAPALANAAGDKDHLLARVAAATSAFPVAFAPVRFEASEKQAMRQLFGPELFPHTAHQDSVYGDGGMVDNYPFGCTIRTIFGRHADQPVDRKLFFIEPDPAGLHGGRRLADASSPADGFDALASFFEAKLYESVAADLRQVTERNRRIAEVNAMLEALEQGLTQFLGDYPGDLRARLQESPLYGPYQQLKVARLQTELAGRLLSKAPTPGTLETHKVHELLAAAVETHEQQVAFLTRFDYPYRVRRLRYFIKRLNRWLGEPVARPAEVRQRLSHFKGLLYVHIEYYLQQARQIWDHMDAVTNATLRVRFDELEQCFEGLMHPDHKDEVRQVIAALEELRQRHALPAAAPLPALFEAYEFFDMHVYPALVLADVGEADPIEVVRVSPDAATRYKAGTNAVTDKLAGGKLMHFSAILKRAWRENDLIWGRLDAAEIITRTLLPNQADPSRPSPAAQEILDALCPAIIREELRQVRTRRRDEIDRTLFTDSDQRRLREILEERNGLDVEASEQYFMSQYNVGSEALQDLSLGYVLRTSSKALRTLSRMLRRLPDKAPAPLQRVVARPVMFLNGLCSVLYYIPTVLEWLGCLRSPCGWLCYVALLLALVLAILIVW